MKKKLNMMLAMAVAVAGLSCQKLSDDRMISDKLSDVNANAVLSTCPIVVDMPITSPTVWTTGNVYLLDDIIEVDNTTLTIEPGVVILGSSVNKGGLVVRPNATIIAEGTECAPIVFTSDKAHATRASGDWFGVALLGEAPNNQSNSLDIDIHGTLYTAGGANASSSVGTFKYVQIHYAGSGSDASSDEKSQSALILGSIGSTSVVEYIQITNSAHDGLGVWGGQPTLRYIFNYEVARSDFKLSYGFRGNMQFMLGFKDQVAALNVVSSHGLEVSNGLNQGVDDGNAPFTYPTISQMSLLGGDHCASNQFDHGIRIRNNGNARIYNSVVAEYRVNGLFLDGANVVANTAASPDQLQFSYNTIHSINGGIGAGYSFLVSSGTWFSNGGCASGGAESMQDWIENLTSEPCAQTSNDIQIPMFALGYAAAFCGDKCTTFPSFELNEDETDLQEANYDNLNLTIFAEAPYTGALQPSGQYSWIQSCNWITFCMQTAQYCI